MTTLYGGTVQSGEIHPSFVGWGWTITDRENNVARHGWALRHSVARRRYQAMWDQVTRERQRPRPARPDHGIRGA